MVYTASIYSATLCGGANELQSGQDLARWFGGRRGLAAMEFPGGTLRHHRCALRGGAECRAVPENATLSLLRGPVDRAAVYSVDRGRASVCLGAPWSRSWSGRCAKGRLSGWLLRGLPRKFRAGHLVRWRSRASFRLDD